jgi:hypothetical protein
VWFWSGRSDLDGGDVVAAVHMSIRVREGNRETDREEGERDEASKPRERGLGVRV